MLGPDAEHDEHLNRGVQWLALWEKPADIVYEPSESPNSQTGTPGEKKETRSIGPTGADETSPGIANGPHVATTVRMARTEEVGESAEKQRAHPPQFSVFRSSIPFVVFGLLVLAVGIFIAMVLKMSDRVPGSSAPSSVAAAGPVWGLVVDMGCEPQDLQRVLKKAQEFPESLRPVAADAGGGYPCWRLVWGHFETRDGAVAALDGIPAEIRHEGFDPHPIELTKEDLDPSGPPGS